MAVKKIVKIWDDKKLLIDNVKFLRTPTKKVTLPAGNQTKQIIQDLIDTYQSISCVGVAANQIGYDKKIFIGLKNLDMKIDVEQIEKAESELSNLDKNIQPDNYEIYINPQIDKIDKKSTDIGSEGCLSIPFLTLAIKRFDKIKVRYYDIEGRKKVKHLSGYLSKVFQHELDHLEGKLMIESKQVFDWDLFSNNIKKRKQYHSFIQQYEKLIR